MVHWPNDEQHREAAVQGNVFQYNLQRRGSKCTCFSQSRKGNGLQLTGDPTAREQVETSTCNSNDHTEYLEEQSPTDTIVCLKLAGGSSPLCGCSMCQKGWRGGPWCKFQKWRHKMLLTTTLEQRRRSVRREEQKSPDLFGNQSIYV